MILSLGQETDHEDGKGEADAEDDAVAGALAQSWSPRTSHVVEAGGYHLESLLCSFTGCGWQCRSSSRPTGTLAIYTTLHMLEHCIPSPISKAKQSQAS